MLSVPARPRAAPREQGRTSDHCGATVWISADDGHTRALELPSGKVLADASVVPSLKGFPGTTGTATAIVTGTDHITALG